MVSTYGGLLPPAPLAVQVQVDGLFTHAVLAVPLLLPLVAMLPLLVNPVPRGALALGKVMASALAGMLAVMVTAGLCTALLRFIPLQELGMRFRFGTPHMVGLMAAALPVCLLTASVQSCVATLAKSFKEAQTTASVVMLVPMIPGVVVSMMELKTAAWMYAVPMLSNQTLLREIAKGGEIGVQPFVLTFFSSLVPALAGFVFDAWGLLSDR